MPLGVHDEGPPSGQTSIDGLQVPEYLEANPPLSWGDSSEARRAIYRAWRTLRRLGP